jgi:hypothetical protein
MRKILTALFALMLMLGSSASIAMAQTESTPAAVEDEDAAASAEGGDTSFAKGLDAEAMYFSERGDPVASLTVTDIERGWQDYGEYYEPDPGVEYVAVTFEISVVSRGNLVAEPFDFSLIDGIGRNNSRSYVSPDEASGVEIFEDDAAVASGETAEMTIVFEVYEETQLGYFMWQPDSGIIIMIDLTEV